MAGKKVMSHTRAMSVVQLFGNKAQKLKPPVSLTSETSKNAMTKRLLDVEREAVIGLRIDAEHRYNNAFANDDKPLQMWYDGYLRAIYHILEMEEE